MDAKLRARLREAVDHFAGGSADAFGQKIGYANGGYIRQSIRPDNPRPVRSALISRINDAPDMKGWFDDIIPPLVAADLRLAAAETPAVYSLVPQVSGMAHGMSPVPFTLPMQMTWEQVMQSKELPERFIVESPDDALAPRLPRGTAVVFERAGTAQPGECVLVRDKRGATHMRRYVQGVGSGFTAQALNDAYASLDSERDGLVVLAVMAWRAERRI